MRRNSWEQGKNAALGNERVEGYHPAVPVWAPIVFVDGSDQMATEVVPLTTGSFDREDGHGMCSGLPGSIEYGRPVRTWEGPFGEPLGAPHCAHRRATPIMASRVTSAASSSSDMSSESAGRIGRTR